jgi:cell pole-organizing protein PopZ
MKDQQPESEASMEEILSSIRQIISADAGDEKKPAPATASPAATGGAGTGAKSTASTAQPVKQGPDAVAKPAPSTATATGGQGATAKSAAPTTQPTTRETMPASKPSTSSAPPQPTAKIKDSDSKSDEVLVLTDIVEKDGRVVSLDSAKSATPALTKDLVKSPPAAPTPAAPPGASSPTPAKAEPKPMAEVNTIDSKSSDKLVSNDAAKATSKSLSQLANTIAEHQAAKDAVPETPLGSGAAKSLEDIVRELMRPMLKDWLDENLPGVVERVVRKEVQKLVRQVED